MRAKTSPNKRRYSLPKGAYKPPRQPRGLTKAQAAEWKRLVRNPALGPGDYDLLLDYARTMKVRDKAAADIQKRGVVVKDRSNPACRVLRDAQHHMLTLRKTLAMNLKERGELHRSGLLQPPEEDDGLEMD